MLKISPKLIQSSLTVSVASVIMLLPPSQPLHAQSDSSAIGFAGADICLPGTIDIPDALKGAPTGDQSELPINIEGDEIQTEGGDKIKLIGNAQVVQGNRGVYANEINFNKETYQAEAAGNVIYYTSAGDEIISDSFELEVDTFIGTAHNATMRFADSAPYFVQREHYAFVEDYSILAPFRNKVETVEPTDPLDDPLLDDPLFDSPTYVRARGAARTIDIEGVDYQILHDATLTTCQEGNNDVLLVAKQIDLDHATGIGHAKSMKVKFKNVPIFYFPAVSFPINDERKTGFLFPGIGYQEDSGTILEIPYYINIGPQHDATVTPRILSQRGVQLYGEYRYLTQDSRGEVRAEFLPSDDVFGDDRHAFSFNHRQDFNQDWRGVVDLQDVSDTEYLRDFSSDVDVGASTFIPQTASVRYFGENWRFNARVSAYERVNDLVSVAGQPFERLPQLDLDLVPQQLGLFEYGLESQFTNYQHDDQTRVDGTRARIKPFVSLPLEEIYGFVTPKVSVQSISYSLDNNPSGDDSPSVTVPISSIDSGLFFERLIKRPDSIYVQTLEPRLFYVNIPERLEQEDFPDFDTGGGSTSSFSHFFRENRFFGGDRVGDTNQLSVGLTSRIIDDDTGEERLKLSLGQVFFFDDREVGLSPDSEPDTENRSDFLAELTAGITEDWDLRVFSRWGSEENNLEDLRISAIYDHSNRRNASISYSRREDENEVVTSEQINFRFDAPVSSYWQLNGRMDYSLEESEIRTAEIGITYDGCCWAAGIQAQRYIDRGEFTNRYIVTFELDDLGKLSSRL